MHNWLKKHSGHNIRIYYNANPIDCFYQFGVTCIQCGDSDTWPFYKEAEYPKEVK